ncbi:MAG: hypothetical protein FGM36_15355 [Burkholderiaceae bacterium]|nr:hypothetical protein [Burkholderiaceae bacterium]
MAEHWQRIFTEGEPWKKKPRGKPESSLQDQSVEQSLRQIENTGNIDLVIDALEIVENAEETKAIHAIYQSWPGGKERALLDGLLEALARRKLPAED